MSKVRKALVAAAGAFLATAASYVFQAGNAEPDTLVRAVAAGFSSAVLVGWATWRVPNAR